MTEKFLRNKKLVEVNREPQTGRFVPKGEIKIMRHITKPEIVLIKGNTRIEKYSGGITKYRDMKTGKFTYKPKE